MKKTILLVVTLFCISNLLTNCAADTEQTATADQNMADEVQVVPASDSPAVLSDYVTEFDSSKYAFRDGIVDLNWQILAMVAFEERHNEELDQYIPYPIFSPTVKALAGKEVYIEGYYIPVDESGDADIVVLSAFPFSACFFCGNAGPESVMDIQLKNKTKLNFKTDDRITFKGKLKLNDTDLYYLNYILEEAEWVKN